MKTAASSEAPAASTRVLLTGDTAGGVWTFVTDLAAGLLETGADVLLATFGPSVSKAQQQHASTIPGLRWHHFRSKLEWMEDPWCDIDLARQYLVGLIDDFRPDLIHLNTLCHGDLPCGVPVVQSVHSCVASWWSAVRQTSLPPEWTNYHAHVEQSLCSAGLLIGPSQAALRELVTHYRADPGKTMVIYNGRSPNVFKPAVKEPMILSAGRLWDEAKNVMMLAQVANDVPWPIYLAGNPVRPFNSEAIFSDCHLLGQLPTAELSAWYGRASIYVLPAKYEPFGLSALEAALSGCALVLGDIPSLREIWLDAAVFVPPASQSALKAVLNHLITDADYRAKMSKRAFKRALKFTQGRMVASYRLAYDKALELHASESRRYACVS